MKEHYDVGVVGCWYWGNYGSLLNGYATFKILESFGLSVLNIVTPYNGFEPHAKIFFEAVYSDDVISPVLPFERVNEFNNNCDIFLTGSDQIWKYTSTKNPQFSEFFRLDFADNDKRKVSFATSFGNFAGVPDDTRKIFSDLMKRYSSISVREDVAVDICQKHFGVDATQVMEPVFDVDIDVWHKVAELSQFPVETEPYLLTYILDPTPEKSKAIQYYAKKLGMKAINILDGFSNVYEKNKQALNLPNTLPNIWCADFLKYYINAYFVISDSFHGTAFAIIFNKPFISIANYGRGISRFETLLGKVNMMNRFVDSNKIPEDEKFLFHLDFSFANKVIANERQRSVDWLRNALLSELSKPVEIKRHIVAALPQNLCMACGSCVASCPTNALSLKHDEHGFYRSYVDNLKCINCGLCTKKCAALQLPDNLNARNPASYAFVCSDVELLMTSTSGGASPVLAKQVLRNGGTVFGATFDNDFSVHHILVDSEQDLPRLQKSKYLQSYLGDIFKSVKEILNTGNLVMFSGLPCQVAGLKKYLGKNYVNLLLIDLLCACCPSELFFKKYLEERFGMDNISKYTFRHKNENDTIWGSNSVAVAKKDGSIKFLVNKDKKEYFASPLVLSPMHCRRCKYQGTTRYGDLTIGDCWGIQHYDKSIDPAKGVSVILVNNEKGESFLNSIPREEFSVLKREPLEQVKKYNVCAFQENRQWPINPQREVFFREILTQTFYGAMEDALKAK